MKQLTKEEEIARQYNATMDSVRLIQRGKPVEMDDSDWQNTVECNKEHIRIMLNKPFWTTEDLTPFQAVLSQ